MTPHSRYSRFVSAVCCGTLIALPWQSAYALSAQASPPVNNGDVRAQFEQLLTAVSKFDAAIPGDTFDPDAIVKQVGREPAALFQWVRDSSVWVPYRGVLRGAVGVLLDRTGNDLDRALLLDELLKRAGKQVRLAHGSLTDARAAALLSSAHRPPASLRPNGAAAPEFNTLRSPFAADATPYGQAVTRLLNGLVQQDTRMSQEAVERSRQAAQRLSDTVGFTARAAAPPSAPPTLDLVRDHWWVQWLNGTAWTDLDPSLPNAQPGERQTEVQDTLDPSGIDPQLFHTVRISVVVERWDQGQLAESTVLSKTLRTSDLFGVDIALVHLPIAWPAGFESTSTRDLTKQGQAVALSQHEWLPVLKVGADAHSEFSFTDEGLQRTGRPGVGTTMARGFEGVASVLGGGSATHSVLTAEWLDYDVSSPGQQARTIRRAVFDRIGPAGRASKSVPEPTVTDRARRDLAATLMGRSDILVLGAQLSRGFVSHLFAQRLAGDGPALLEVLSTRLDSVQAVQKISGRVTPLPGPLYDLALARSAWSSVRREVYVDRPVIFSAHSAGHETANGVVKGTYAFDIVSNDVAVRADAKSDPATLRLTQGVVDTTAEAILAAAMGNDTKPAQRPVTNAGDMLARTADGIHWIAIRSANDPSWQRVQLDADARARLGEDVAAGFVVVVPDRTPVINGQAAFTWWRIDPKTGTSLGRGPQGWGQSMAEYAILVLDTCLCASEFGHGVAEDNFASALGMLLCVVLGASALMAWLPIEGAVAAGIEGAEAYKEVGVNFLLAQAIFAGLVKVWDLASE